tara:strand:- start:4331 stop:6100 length:1770 start_codon:yes stop_codon:yes gene_type:complete
MADNEKKSFFNSNFMKSVASRLPYQTPNADDLIGNLNPKYQEFQTTGVRRTEALANQSVFYQNDYNTVAAGQVSKEGQYAELVYANIEENKSGRLRDYRIMASFAEISDALDEICDQVINIDDSGNIVKLKFRNTDLKEEDQLIVEKEFEKYIDYFGLERKGFEYFRQMLCEGEVFFEHIIHKEYTKEGILGIVQLPSDLIDSVYDNIQNMLIKGYILRKPIFDPNKPDKVEKMEYIPMDNNQVTYCHSGIWNQDKTFRLPFIENSRRAYRQLSLVEDSIVIYRLVRAPERLVFNVDVGNMAPPKAEAYLRKLIQQYWSKKTFDVNQEGAVQKFNPQSMLDSFWFAKRAGSDGTSVTQLQGGANLGELADLMYFVNKLYKSLKVPVNRLNPDEKAADGSEILRDELKFAKFIIRLQQQFAAGLKNGFLTHIELKGIKEKYGIKEQNLHLEFNVPTNFFELRENQKLELKATNYNNLAANEFISATYGQKKYLGWNENDIKTNRELLRKDAEFQWELQQIAGGGPNWKDELQAAPGMGDEVSGLQSGVPAGVAPDFGGSPADTGGEADTGVEAEVAAEGGDEAGPAEPAV